VKTLRLSEIVTDYDTLVDRVLEKKVLTPDGRELGIVDEVHLNRDRTPKKVVVKDGNNLGFVIDAKHLILKDGVLILQEPIKIDLLHAMKETCKALLELLEASSQDDPQNSHPEVSAAKEHLRSALKVLEKA